MFDFSFSELLLCFVVALVVLGPERLPGIARGLGRWTGQAKAYMRNLSAELERESQVAEIKKQVTDAHRILKEESAAFHGAVKTNIDILKTSANQLEPEGRASAVSASLAAPVVSEPEAKPVDDAAAPSPKPHP
jgi:sec-independent protein translocase protein TatB